MCPSASRPSSPSPWTNRATAVRRARLSIGPGLVLLPLAGPQLLQPSLQSRLGAAVARLVEPAPGERIGQVLLLHPVPLEVVWIPVGTAKPHLLHQRRRGRTKVR